MNTPETFPHAPIRQVTAALSTLALVALSLVGSTAPAAAAPPPEPTAAILNPDEAATGWTGMIGKDTTFTVGFDNQGQTIGYGPYLDVYLPTAGDDGDDGLQFLNANYLGAPITAAQTISCAGNSITHALTNQDVPCPAGQQLLVFELPFGSFTPKQPRADLTINAAVPKNMAHQSNHTIKAAAGFQYGDSATGSTPVKSGTTENTFTGTAITFTKKYLGPEDETATGPNFPQKYQLTADLAEGFSAKDLTFTDVLPDGMQYLKITSASAGGQSTTTPSTSTPGGELNYTWGNVTGTSADDDARLEFTWYVPKADAQNATILDPITGDDVPMTADASWAASTIIPADPDDAPLTGATARGNPQRNQAEAKDHPDNHQLSAQSIAVQKSVNTETSTPGGSLRYTVNTQVSDFFTVDAVKWTDIVPDGITITNPPTSATVIEQGQPARQVALTTNIITDDSCSRIQPGIQALMVALPADLVLAGGRTSTPTGGTTIQFQYDAQVLDNYRCFNGASNVSAADALTNYAAVDANILDNNTKAVTDTERDDTKAKIEIPKPVVTKEVIGRNGSTDLATSPPEYFSGDTVTYRMQVPIPSGDLQNFTLTDYLPLPVFALTGLVASDNCSLTNLPETGKICYGPADQMGNISALPQPVIDGPGNSFALYFGDVSNPANTATLLDLIFTTTIRDAAYLDQLYLTNQVQIEYQNNVGTDFTENAIAQVKMLAPYLKLRKGVVSTSDENDPYLKYVHGPRGDGFPAPGTPGCPAGPMMNRSDFAAGWPDANVTGMDTSERVRLVVAVHNSGHLDATNVRIDDLIPEHMAIPTDGVNLCVHSGTGQPVPHTPSGFFAGEQNTPTGSVTLGVPIDGTNPEPGTDIMLISYDLVINQDAPVGEELSSPATIGSFNAPNKSANFAPLVRPKDRTDPASVKTKNVAVVKAMESTSHDGTPGTDLVVGEKATYSVIYTLPEGSYTDVVIQDDLPAELGMVSFDSMTIGDQLHVPNPNDPQFTVGGNKLYLYLDKVKNIANDPDVDDEQITITYTVQLKNVASAQAGKTVRNIASMLWDGKKQTIGSFTSLVREPELTTTKTVAPPTVDAADTVTYVITTENPVTDAGTTAYDVTITDQVPAQLSVVPGTLELVAGSVPALSGPTLTGDTITATFAQIDVGAKVAFQFDAKVADDLAIPSTIENTTTSTWTSLPGDQDGERTGADGPGGLNDHSTSDTAKITTVTGDISKTITGTSAAHTADTNVTIGEVVDYQLTVTLPEGDLAQGFTIADQVPAGLAYVADSASVQSTGLAGTLGAHALTATPGAVGTDLSWVFEPSTVTADGNPETSKITLTAKLVVADVPSNTGNPATALPNTATVTIGDGPTITSDPVTVTVVEPLVKLTKTADTNSVQPGATVTFTMTATNDGTADAFNVALTDVVPAEFDPATIKVGSTSCGFTGAVANKTLTYTGGQIAIGESCPVTFTATIAAGVTADTITNTVTGTYTSLPDPGTGRDYTPDDATATIGLISPDLSVTKDDGKTTSAPGDTTTYTITVNNIGAADASGVLVNDTLPANTTLVNTDGSAAECVAKTAPAGQVAFELAELAAGASVNCAVTVQVNAALPAGTSTLTNTVTVSDPGSSYTDPTPENNTDTDTNTIPRGAPDLTISKTDGVTSTTAGSTLTYTLTVTNQGSKTATNVVVTDTLGDFLAFESCTVTKGAVAVPCAATGADVSTTLTSLDVGATATVQVVAGVATALPNDVTSVTNTATVTDDGRNGPDPTPDNNTDTDTDTVTTTPDMTISKTDGVDTVNVGDQVTYTVTIANVGDAAATGVTVVDTLPAQMRFDSCSDGCALTNTNELTWTNLTETGDSGATPGAFDPATSRQVTVTATVMEPALQYTNTATVADDGQNGPDPTPENNTDTDVDTTTASTTSDIDLALAKTTVSAQVVPGAPVTYAIKVTNNGPTAVTTVTVLDRLPIALSSPAYSVTSGSYNATTGLWTGLDLTPGSSETLQITATLAADASGELSNTATVSPPPGLTDVVPDNNTDTVNDPIAPKVATELVKTQVGDLVVGGNATYILTLTNTGPSTITNATINDTLPAGLEFKSAGGPDWSCVQTRCEYQKPLASGQKAAVTVVATITAPAGTQVTNTAVVEKVTDPGGNTTTPTDPPATVTDEVQGPPSQTPTPTTPPTPTPTPTPSVPDSGGTTDPTPTPTPTPTGTSTSDPFVPDGGGSTNPTPTPTPSPSVPEGGGSTEPTAKPTPKPTPKPDSGGVEAPKPKSPTTLSNTGAWTALLAQIAAGLVFAGVAILVFTSQKRRRS